MSKNSLISYKANGGKFSSGKDEKQVLGEVDKKIKNYNPKDISRDGYSFKYWSLDEKGIDKLLDDEEIEAGKSYNVYAQWDKNHEKDSPNIDNNGRDETINRGSSTDKIEFSFDGNEGLVEGKKEIVYTIPRGSKVNEKNDLEREGYHFLGWSIYKDKIALFDFSKAIQKNTTVYAIWTDELNRHISYIEGYEDGTVRAEDEITRAEVAAILYRILEYSDMDIADIESLTYPYIDQSYEWSKNYIKQLTKDSLLKGYPNGEFRPNNSITRAELAVIISRYKKLDNGENSFMDVTDHWAEKEIGYALNMGYIKGYPDGTFRPNKMITRAEAVTIVNRVIDRGLANKDIPEDIKVLFIDLDYDKWYFNEVIEAAKNHEYLLREKDKDVRKNEVWKR